MIEFSQFSQQIIVIVVTVALMVLLLIEKIKPAFIFFGSVLIFLLTKTISTHDFLEALSNESVLSIFLLIFITYGVRTNYNILAWMDKLFGGAKTGRGFIIRMSSVVSAFSSFLNNTPIVALFLPYVYQWSNRRNIAASKLLIPLSYAAMAGGMITVIGTSTNLILKGLVESEGGTPPGFMDYLLPGLLVTILTIIYLSTLGYAILPTKEKIKEEVLKKQREYIIEVELSEEAEIIGKTIREAELVNMEGVDLLEIIRSGMRISPVYSYERIRAGDKLVFVGNSDRVIELLEQREDFVVPHLESAEENNPLENEADAEQEEQNEDNERQIIETLIPTNSSLIGRTLTSANFRETYDAVVIGIHRNGSRLKQQIDRTRLRAGDLMLVVPGKNFRKDTRREDDLYVVSVIKQVSGVSTLAKRGFLALTLAGIAGLFFTDLSLFFVLLLLISYMISTRMVGIEDLKKQFSVDLFVILVASLAFSTALIKSGVAEMAANGFMTLFEPMGKEGILIGIYLVTLLIGSFVTHAAAVAIVFPIAFSIGSQMEDLNMIAIYIAMAFAASASFHTPFSYQTNMMVYGPGGYKFSDFLKAGTPLTVLYSIAVIMFILFYYGF